jgi:hypothetical protein
MPVYIETPTDYGWVLRNKRVKSSHLLSDDVDLTELHRIAQAGGMKRSWFQNHPDHPHYDIAASRYAGIVAAGAIEVDRNGLVAAVKRRREAVAAAKAKAGG